MRIVEHSGNRLVLRGSPSGRTPAVVGAAMLAIAFVGALILLGASRGGNSLGAIAAVVVLALLAAIGIAALLTAALRTEELTIEGASGECRHVSRWRMVGRERVTTFQAADVDHVALTHRLERTGGGRCAPDSEVWEATIRIRNPRRSHVLVSASVEQRVRPIAEAAAVALGVSLTDEAGDEREMISGAETGVPITKRKTGRTSLDDLPDVPPGTRVLVRVVPASGEAPPSVALDWRLLRKPWIMLPFAMVTGLFTLASIFFLVAALGWVNGKSAGAGAVVACAGVVLFCGAFCWFFVTIGWLARVRIEITPDAAVAYTDFPGRVLLPGAASRLARRCIPLGEVESVRSRSATDHIEIVSDRCTLRAWLHLPEDGELAWIAATVRASIASLS